MDRIDCVVIGAGVIGLACARALAMAGREVVVIERASGIGTETSARNSEVIHAGIYYPAGSQKALHCLRGRQKLYQYCEEQAVSYRRCGKLIVASTSGQIDSLRALQQKALVNGVSDMALLPESEVRNREPDLQCKAALWSPSTGIFDSHAFMLSLLGEVESHGGTLVLQSPLQSGRVTDRGVELFIGGESPVRLLAGSVINAGGLWAQDVARSIAGLDPALIPRQYLARGVYFALQGKAPFSQLVYPLPENGGLGCHFTLDLNGKGRFGPDVEWVTDIDFKVDQHRALAFYESIRQYWPDIPEGALLPDYAGIRPKVAAPGDDGDFIIQGPGDHGVQGLVNLYGIESPGLTASLSIAEAVKQALES